MSVETIEAEVKSDEQEAASPELTVSDLNMLKQVIDVATQRGAFKANELVQVGTVYNKLETFLNAVASQQPQSKGDK
jgi:hypothetical protein